MITPQEKISKRWFRFSKPNENDQYIVIETYNGKPAGNLKTYLVGYETQKNLYRIPSCKENPPSPEIVDAYNANRKYDDKNPYYGVVLPSNEVARMFPHIEITYKLSRDVVINEETTTIWATKKKKNESAYVYIDPLTGKETDRSKTGNFNNETSYTVDTNETNEGSATVNKFKTYLWLDKMVVDGHLAQPRNVGNLYAWWYNCPEDITSGAFSDCQLTDMVKDREIQFSFKYQDVDGEFDGDVNYSDVWYASIVDDIVNYLVGGKTADEIMALMPWYVNGTGTTKGGDVLHVSSCKVCNPTAFGGGSINIVENGVSNIFSVDEYGNVTFANGVIDDIVKKANEMANECVDNIYTTLTEGGMGTQIAKSDVTPFSTSSGSQSGNESGGENAGENTGGNTSSQSGQTIDGPTNPGIDDPGNNMAGEHGGTLNP